MLSRVFDHGYPWDMVFNTRLMSLIRNSLPGPLSRGLINYRVNQWFKHENYGLQLEKRYFFVAPIPCGVTGLVLWAGGRSPATNINQCSKQHPDWADVQFVAQREMIRYSPLKWCEMEHAGKAQEGQEEFSS